MNVTVDKDVGIKYNYTIEKGINEVDGGIEVLRQMNYPAYMLQNIDWSSECMSIWNSSKFVYFIIF